MTQTELKSFVDSKCAQKGLDKNLIKAIITVESNWVPDTYRCEINVIPAIPGTSSIVQDALKYTITPRDFASNLGISINSEVVLQKSSYGLMQLMGFNFRALGFTKILTKCFDPEINTEYGLNFFIKNCDKYHDLNDKIASYNSGSPKRLATGAYINQQYVDKVLIYYNLLLKDSIL